MVTPQQFGAVGDGVTDDHAAFQTALDKSQTVHVPFTLNGYALGSPLILAGGKASGWQTFTADRGTRLIGGGLAIAGWYTEVRGFTLDGEGVAFDTSKSNVYKCRIADCLFQNCKQAIADSLTASNYVADLQVTDCHCWLTRGPQVRLSRSRGLILFRDFVIDFTQNTWPGLWDGAIFEDVIGMELERFDVMGGNAASVPSNGPATLRITGGVSVWLTRVLVDGWRGAGVRLQNLDNVFAAHLESYASLGDALSLSGITNAQLANVASYGALDVPGALPGAVGLSLTNCRQVGMTNVRSVRNMGACVVLNNSSACRLVNVQHDGPIVFIGPNNVGNYVA